MINIKHPEADKLARALAQQTGETIKEALLAIGQRCANLPNHDTRTADEILGYDSDGLPR